MNDTNAIIDKWRGARCVKCVGWHSPGYPVYFRRLNRAMPWEEPDCPTAVTESCFEAISVDHYERRGGRIPEYATDANLIQPMLGRCIEVGWNCCGPTWRYGGGWKVLLRCGVMYRSGSSASLSEALTQAIVAMIEATNQGETDGTH